MGQGESREDRVGGAKGGRDMVIGARRGRKGMGGWGSARREETEWVG